MQRSLSLEKNPFSSAFHIWITQQFLNPLPFFTKNKDAIKVAQKKTHFHFHKTATVRQTYIPHNGLKAFIKMDRNFLTLPSLNRHSITIGIIQQALVIILNIKIIVCFTNKDLM